MSYVVSLIAEIFFVSDSMFVMAWVPDFTFVLLADGVGEAAFEELDAAR